jgi:hypothetical protein
MLSSIDNNIFFYIKALNFDISLLKMNFRFWLVEKECIYIQNFMNGIEVPDQELLQVFRCIVDRSSCYLSFDRQSTRVQFGGMLILKISSGNLKRIKITCDGFTQNLHIWCTQQIIPNRLIIIDKTKDYFREILSEIFSE